MKEENRGKTYSDPYTRMYVWSEEVTGDIVFRPMRKGACIHEEFLMTPESVEELIKDLQGLI